MEDNFVKAIYKGKEISCERITLNNLKECEENARVGYYGIIEIGRYLYWTGSGYDYFIWFYKRGWIRIYLNFT